MVVQEMVKRYSVDIKGSQNVKSPNSAWEIASKWADKNHVLPEETKDLGELIENVVRHHKNQCPIVQFDSQKMPTCRLMK